ncbi:MAG: cysteine desulfurase [Bacteroidia bacterium]|nr:cysteine desulfurase [Bacteroidia bacterium]
MKVYFDNAATTPIDPEVLETMIPVMREDFGNPSSSHSYGRKVKALLEQSRKTIAALLNVTPGEICFTSGGTEADNFAIRCGVESLGIKNIITSPTEHHAVLHTAEELDKKGIVKMHFVKVTSEGHIDLSDLERLLIEFPGSLVSLMHANNEIGALLDITKTGELCKKHNAYFHSDTVQTMGHYKMDLENMPVDFATGAAHKFNGPKGVGFLYISKKLKIQPLITGGSQERDLRGGTENIYGIVGMAKAFEICMRECETKSAQIQAVKTYMIECLKDQFPEIKFNGNPEEKSLYTVLNVAFPPSDLNEMLLFGFDLRGIAVSGGSACTSGSNKGSHVIRAIGKNLDHTPVRFSFGKYNTKEEVDYVLSQIQELLKPAGVLNA